MADKSCIRFVEGDHNENRGHGRHGDAESGRKGGMNGKPKINGCQNDRDYHTDMISHRDALPR